MSAREDMWRRLYEACLSGSVTALNALIKEDQLILNRVNLLTDLFNDTPLHVAASRGHLELTKALLLQKPELALELESLRCSLLHLASTEGHVEIVQELLRMNTNVCLIRDQDGRTPLHLAAIRGRVEVIRKLLQAKPKSIHEKLNRGETVLHLCVKYNKLEALKTLVENLQDNELLLGSGDDDGNTILHLAVALKQMDTIKYLLGIKSVKEHCANVKNRNGSTTLDVADHCPNRDLKTMEIREFLLQVGVQRSIYDGSDLNPKSQPDDYNPPPPPCHCGFKVLKATGHCISSFWIKYVAVDPRWLKQVRGHLITASTLTATMAYQAILNPPGGLWQEDKVGHKAGEAILNNKVDVDYYGQPCNRSLEFLVINIVMLIASLFTIMLVLTGFPYTNKLLLWLLIFTVYITIFCMANAYFLAIAILFPSQMENYLFLRVLREVSFAWVVVIAFVLVFHTCRFLVWLGKKISNLVRRCFCGRRQRRQQSDSPESSYHR